VAAGCLALDQRAEHSMRSGRSRSAAVRLVGRSAIALTAKPTIRPPEPNRIVTFHRKSCAGNQCIIVMRILLQNLANQLRCDIGGQRSDTMAAIQPRNIKPFAGMQGTAARNPPASSSGYRPLATVWSKVGDLLQK
jgi:hypothetical protein